MVISDLPMILSWRNNSFVRSCMFNKSIIQTDEHLKWFNNAATDKNKWLLIYELNGNPSGFIQLQRLLDSSDTLIWGFYRNPEIKGGIGKKMGVTAINYAFNNIDFINLIIGRVLKSNIRSISFHEGLGFELVVDEHLNSEEVIFKLRKNDWLRISHDI